MGGAAGEHGVVGGAEGTRGNGGGGGWETVSSVVHSPMS